MRVIAYCRVSTLNQTNAGQIELINKYANQNQLVITDRIEAQISSRRSKKERLDWLNDLGKGDILIVAELSRLGRSMSELIQTINELKERNIEVHIIDRKLILRQKSDLQSTIMVGLFSILAEVERSLISERTKRGLEASKNKGGRPRKTKYDLLYIVSNLNSGLNIEQTAKNMNIPPTSIRSLIKSGYIAKVNLKYEITS